MLSDKHAALAGKLDATQTALFTTGALTMKTVTPVSAGKANAAKPSARYAPGVAAARQTKPTTMSMLGASFKGSGAVSMGQQASLGGMQKAAESFPSSAPRLMSSEALAHPLTSTSPTLDPPRLPPRRPPCRCSLDLQVVPQPREPTQLSWEHLDIRST